MQLLTKEITEKLLKNGERTLEAQKVGKDEPDHTPVVKMFLPGTGATWLFTEMDPAEHDLLFGLCDLGQGFPELGWTSLSEISEPVHVRTTINGRLVRMPMSVERDLYWTATKTISQYADEARRNGAIKA